MDTDAFNDIVAVEKRPPSEDQQVRQPGVDESVIQRLSLA